MPAHRSPRPLQLGRDEPNYSMDPSGKLIYTRNTEVLSANLAAPADNDDLVDGARLALSVRDLGTTEIFASALAHSPNGRFVTVVGDGEYIIYTALAWCNKAFGNGWSFACAADSNTYAVLETRTKIRVFKNFKERAGAPMKGVGGWSVEGLHGGPLRGAWGSGFVMFWDWETGEIVRRIEVSAKNVSSACYAAWHAADLSLCEVTWSGSGELVAIIADDSFYMLRFDRSAYNESGEEIGEEGVEEAFDVVAEISDRCAFPSGCCTRLLTDGCAV